MSIEPLGIALSYFLRDPAIAAIARWGSNSSSDPDPLIPMDGQLTG